MSKALSVDLRDLVVAAIDSGLSCRQAAARFEVSEASAICWRSLFLTRGDVRPGPLGGDRRSGRIESQAEVILGLVEHQPDITLAEIRVTLPDTESKPTQSIQDFSRVIDQMSQLLMGN